MGGGTEPHLHRLITAIVDGRRFVYLRSLPCLCIGSIGVANSHAVPTVMFWRVVQAFGASSAMSVGAGVIGDIYRLEERGFAMGLFFGVSHAECSSQATFHNDSLIFISGGPSLTRLRSSVQRLLPCAEVLPHSMPLGVMLNGPCSLWELPHSSQLYSGFQKRSTRRSSTRSRVKETGLRS